MARQDSFSKRAPVLSALWPAGVARMTGENMKRQSKKSGEDLKSLSLMTPPFSL
jgi:hypothetical protein